MAIENSNGTGDANDAAIYIEERPASHLSDEDFAEQQRVHAYLIHIEDGRRAVDMAHAKVRQAEADLDGAEKAVEQAEAELAVLEGRE